MMPRQSSARYLSEYEGGNEYMYTFGFIDIQISVSSCAIVVVS